jgi:hypothetical protein
MAAYDQGVSRDTRIAAGHLDKNEEDYLRRVFKVRANQLLDYRWVLELPQYGAAEARRRQRDRVKALLHPAELLGLVPAKGTKGPAGALPGHDRGKRRTSDLAEAQKEKHRARRNDAKGARKAASSAVFLAMTAVVGEGGSAADLVARISEYPLASLPDEQVRAALGKVAPEAVLVRGVLPIARRTESVKDLGSLRQRFAATKFEWWVSVDVVLAACDLLTKHFC